MSFSPVGSLAVDGLRELQKAARSSDKELAKFVRTGIREIAKPVARTAELLASTEIRKMTPAWDAVKVGSTQRDVYIAPQHPKTHLRKRKRPNMAGLLLNRAYGPAVEKHEPRIVREFEQFLDRLNRKEW